MIFTDARKLEKTNLSTHSLSFSVMMKMLPGIEMHLFGVQPVSLEFGEKMSDEAKKGAEKIIEKIDSL